MYPENNEINDITYPRHSLSPPIHHHMSMYKFRRRQYTRRSDKAADHNCQYLHKSTEKNPFEINTQTAVAINHVQLPISTYLDAQRNDAPSPPRRHTRTSSSTFPRIYIHQRKGHHAVLSHNWSNEMPSDTPFDIAKWVNP